VLGDVGIPGSRFLEGAGEGAMAAMVAFHIPYDMTCLKKRVGASNVHQIDD